MSNDALDDDSTIDSTETIESWIERRTKASDKGQLSPEIVLELYQDETSSSENDIYTITRILATLYEATLIHNQLVFKAVIPY